MTSKNLVRCIPVSRSNALLLASVLAGGIFVSPVMSQSAPSATPPTTGAQTAVPTAAATIYQPQRFPKREHSYYQLFWGVDQISAKATESGELIKFSYRVLDPEKAKTLNDRNNEPVMYDPAIRAKLIVPCLEKVGQLRQASTPEAGRIDWMAFSNPGRVVKRGDRVDVVIGQFHIGGLVVE